MVVKILVYASLFKVIVIVYFGKYSQILSSSPPLLDFPRSSRLHTSYEKSTCPGVSMRLRMYVMPSSAGYSILAALSLMVMPLSLSRSMLSRSCFFISLSATALQYSSNLVLTGEVSKASPMLGNSHIKIYSREI